MGCNGCGQKRVKSPERTPMRVAVHSFSPSGAPLKGRASSANYGTRKDGDTLIVWTSDYLEMRDVLKKPDEDI